MPPVLIATGNYHYCGWSLSDVLKDVRSFSPDVSGAELALDHSYRFDAAELSLLEGFSLNTVHLGGLTSAKDREWIDYCRSTVPHLDHFTLHPDSTDLDFFESQPDIHALVSFENMDPRKPAFQTAEEMRRLFRRFPQARFTFDVNHALENRLDASDFASVPNLNKYHLSSVNRFPENYYAEWPEIDTPHALVTMDHGFSERLDGYLWKNVPIVLEGVFPPNDRGAVEREVAWANRFRDYFASTAKQ